MTKIYEKKYWRKTVKKKGTMKTNREEKEKKKKRDSQTDRDTISIRAMRSLVSKTPFQGCFFRRLGTLKGNGKLSFDDSISRLFFRRLVTLKGNGRKRSSNIPDLISFGGRAT